MDLEASPPSGVGKGMGGGALSKFHFHQKTTLKRMMPVVKLIEHKNMNFEMECIFNSIVAP
jgi:hypothetical protein